MKFSQTDSSGQEVCAVTLSRLWGTGYGLARKLASPSSDQVSLEKWLDLVEQALSHAKSIGAREVAYRLIHADDSAVISRMGGHQGHG